MSSKLHTKAFHCVDELYSKGLISQSTAETALMILLEIGNSCTVTAHVSPDSELGCCLYRVEGKASIEFSFTGNNDIFCRVTDPKGTILVEEVTKSPNYESMKQWLHNFTTYVEQAGADRRENENSDNDEHFYP